MPHKVQVKQHLTFILNSSYKNNGKFPSKHFKSICLKMNKLSVKWPALKKTKSYCGVIRYSVSAFDAISTAVLSFGHFNNSSYLFASQ